MPRCEGRTRWRASLVAGLVALSGWPAISCDRASVAPSPTPSPAPIPSVVTGSRSGPVEIVFVSASPEPGSTITGCGETAVGCAGRVRMRVRFNSSTGGQALGLRAWLFATTKRACLYTEHGPFTIGRSGLAPPVPQAATEQDLVFDRADACPVPGELTNLAVVIEGDQFVASRQEWALRYSLSR